MSRCDALSLGRVSGQRPPSASQTARPSSGRDHSPVSGSGRYSPPLLAAWHGTTVTRRADSAHSARRPPPVAAAASDTFADTIVSASTPFHFAPSRSSDPAVRSAASSAGCFVRRTNPIASLRLLSLASDAAAAIEVSQRREQLHRLVLEAEAKEQMHAAQDGYVAGESWPANPAMSQHATTTSHRQQQQQAGWSRHTHDHNPGHYGSTPSSPSAQSTRYSQQMAQTSQPASARARSFHAPPSRTQQTHAAHGSQVNPNHPHAHAHLQQQSVHPSNGASTPRRTPHRPAGAAAKTPRAAASFQRPRSPPPYVFAPATPATGSQAHSSAVSSAPTSRQSSASTRELPLPLPPQLQGQQSLPLPPASTEGAPVVARSPTLEPLAPLSPKALLSPMISSVTMWSAATSTATSGASSRIVSPIASRAPSFQLLQPLETHAAALHMDLLPQPSLLAVPAPAATQLRAHAALQRSQAPPTRPQQAKSLQPPPQPQATLASDAAPAVAVQTTPVVLAPPTALAVTNPVATTPCADSTLPRDDSPAAATAVSSSSSARANSSTSAVAASDEPAQQAPVPTAATLASSPLELPPAPREAAPAPPGTDSAVLSAPATTAATPMASGVQNHMPVDTPSVSSSPQQQPQQQQQQPAPTPRSSSATCARGDATTPPDHDPTDEETKQEEEEKEGEDEEEEEERDEDEESEDEEEAEEPHADDGRHSPLEPIAYDDSSDEAEEGQQGQVDASPTVPSAVQQAEPQCLPTERPSSSLSETRQIEADQPTQTKDSLASSAPSGSAATGPSVRPVDQRQQEHATASPTASAADQVVEQSQQPRQQHRQKSDAADVLELDDDAPPTVLEPAETAVAPAAPADDSAPAVVSSESLAPLAAASIVTAVSPVAVASSAPPAAAATVSEKSSKSTKQSGRSGARAKSKSRRPSMSVAASTAPSTLPAPAGHARRLSHASTKALAPSGASSSALGTSPSTSPTASRKKSPKSKAAKKRKASVSVVTTAATATSAAASVAAAAATAATTTAAAAAKPTPILAPVSVPAPAPTPETATEAVEIDSHNDNVEEGADDADFVSIDESDDDGAPDIVIPAAPRMSVDFDAAAIPLPTPPPEADLDADERPSEPETAPTAPVPGATDHVGASASQESVPAVDAIAAPVASLAVPTPKHARTPSSGSTRSRKKKSPRAAASSASTATTAEPKAKTPKATKPPKTPKSGKALKAGDRSQSQQQLQQKQRQSQQPVSEAAASQEHQQPTVLIGTFSFEEVAPVDAPADSDSSLNGGLADSGVDQPAVSSSPSLSPAPSPAPSPRRRGPTSTSGLSKGRAAKLAPSPVATSTNAAPLVVQSAAIGVANSPPGSGPVAAVSVVTSMSTPAKLAPSPSASPKHGPTSWEESGSRRSRPSSSPLGGHGTPTAAAAAASSAAAAAALAADSPLSLANLSEFGAAPRRLKPRAWTPMPAGRASPVDEEHGGGVGGGVFTTSRKVSVLHMQLPADAPSLVRPVSQHREGMMQHSSAHAAPPPLTAEELRGSPTSPSSTRPSSGGATVPAGALDEFAQALMRRRKRGSGPGGEGGGESATPDRLHLGRSRAASPPAVLTEQERELIAAEALANGESGANIFSGQSIYGASGVLQGSGLPSSDSPPSASSHGYTLQARPTRPELDVSLTRGVGFDHVSPTAAGAAGKQSLPWGFGFKDKDQRWVQRVRNEIVPESSNPYRTRAPTQTLVEFLAALSTAEGRSPAAWRYTPYKKKHLAAARSYDEDVDDNGVENPKRKRYRDALQQLQAEALARGQGDGAGAVLPSFPSYEEFESDQKDLEAEARRQRFLALYDATDDADGGPNDEQGDENAAESGRRSPARAPFPTARLLYLPECDLEPSQCADVNCLHYEERLLAEAHAQKLAERAERARVRAAKQAEQTRRANEYNEWLKMSDAEKEAVLLVRERAKEAAAKAAAEEAARKAEQAEKDKWAADRAERAAVVAAAAAAAATGVADKTVQSPALSAASPPVAPSTPAPLPLAELVLLQPERFELSPRGYNARRASLHSPKMQSLPSPTGAAAIAVVAAAAAAAPPATTVALGSAPDAYAVTPAAVQHLPLLSLVTDFNDVPVQLVGRRVSQALPPAPMPHQPKAAAHAATARAGPSAQRQRRFRHHGHTRSMVEALQVQAAAGRLAAQHPHEPELLRPPSAPRDRSPSPVAGAATVRKITARNMQPTPPAPEDDTKLPTPPPPPPPPPPALFAISPAVQAAFVAARRRASTNPNDAPAQHRGSQ